MAHIIDSERDMCDVAQQQHKQRPKLLAVGEYATSGTARVFVQRNTHFYVNACVCVCKREEDIVVYKRPHCHYNGPYQRKSRDERQKTRKYWYFGVAVCVRAYNMLPRNRLAFSIAIAPLLVHRPPQPACTEQISG